MEYTFERSCKQPQFLLVTTSCCSNFAVLFSVPGRTEARGSTTAICALCTVHCALMSCPAVGEASGGMACYHLHPLPHGGGIDGELDGCFGWWLNAD